MRIVRVSVTLITSCAMVLASSPQLHARGGGGRGGGGFHGGGGGGRSFSGGGGGGGRSFSGGGGGGGRSFSGGGGGGRSSLSHTGSFNQPRGNMGGGNFGAGDRGNFSANRGNPYAGGGRAGSGQTFSPSAIAKGGGARPGGGEGIRPGGGGERPGGGIRPGGGGDRPGGGGNRPGGGGDRPGGGGNRPGGGGDRPGGGGNRPGQGNRPGNRPGDNNLANNNFNRTNNFNNINHNDWHHGNWNNHWDHNWNHWPNGWGHWGWGGWGWGFGAGLAVASIPWAWGYSSYANPYYVSDGGGYDYSQPILASGTYEAPGTEQPAEGQSPAVTAATASFDAARAAFQQGDYATALAQVDQAIAKVPNDTNLHEFRALVLFAQKQYSQAAAAVYDVLSSGPGWDWTTMVGLYPSAETYTQQLRALEDYCRKNPNASDARFLLAYQYLTCGQTAAAATEFKQAAKLNPKDTLSAQMVTALTPPAEGEQAAPAPAPAPASPATPITAEGLAGSWTATRPDGGSIALALSKDAKYSWKYTQPGGKSQSFDGNYTVADGLLILNQNNTPAMIGQVAQLPGNSFSFKMAGGSPDDPGLTFKR